MQRINNLYKLLGNNDVALILAFIVGFVSTIPFNVNTTDVNSTKNIIPIIPFTGLYLFLKILIIGIIFSSLYAIIISWVNYFLPDRAKPILSILMILQLLMTVFWLSYAVKLSINMTSEVISNIAISKKITTSSNK